MHPKNIVVVYWSSDLYIYQMCIFHLLAVMCMGCVREHTAEPGSRKAAHEGRWELQSGTRLGKAIQLRMPFSPFTRGETRDCEQPVIDGRLTPSFLLTQLKPCAVSLQLNPVLSPWVHFRYLNSGPVFHHLHQTRVFIKNSFMKLTTEKAGNKSEGVHPKEAYILVRQAITHQMEGQVVVVELWPQE